MPLRRDQDGAGGELKATFRFHGDLNDFLAPERRHREFIASCARAATTKHMIEALGVPHTEVERILVNGEVAGLDRLLRDGDRVAVHPWSKAPAAPRATRFIADAHLGGLARMLRMAGFDTLYRNDYADAQIAAIATGEGRTVLTRDRELLKLRDLAHGCYVHALKPERQFREIVDRLGLSGGLRPFSRCLECNGLLHEVDKARVIERLPPAVRLSQERFTACDGCDRVYWRGSHWLKMRTLLADMVNEPRG